MESPFLLSVDRTEMSFGICLLTIFGSWEYCAKRELDPKLVSSWGVFQFTSALVQANVEESEDNWAVAGELFLKDM